MRQFTHKMGQGWTIEIDATHDLPGEFEGIHVVGLGGRDILGAVLEFGAVLPNDARHTFHPTVPAPVLRKIEGWAVAFKFRAGVFDFVGPERMANIDELNRNEQDTGTCHSHDHCDANEFMNQAIFDAMGFEYVLDAEHQEHRYLWNDAWLIAFPHDGSTLWP